ncbi:hypothetical protein Lser_V15G40116 [Lactuca serriola]
MADSSSVHATTHILPICPQQSLIIDLTPHAYDAFMFPIIECLKFSPIAPTLTRAETVPMEFLSQIFATAHYDKVVDIIFFDVFEHKASISKQRFCSLLGFDVDSSRVNPESIPMGHLFNMFYNMGYTEVLTTVTKFKKSCLPPQWNGMFTILFKGLSERSVGSDGASRLFLSIMYGIYNGINMDYGSDKGKQVVKGAKGPSPKKRKSTRAAQSPQQKKRKTQPRRKLVIASSSSESDGESSDSEGSQRGNTPPRSPTPEVHVPPSPFFSPPKTIPTSIPPITPTTQIPTTSIPIPPIFTEATTTTTAEVRTNVSDTGVHTDAPKSTPAPEPTPTPETTQPEPTNNTAPPASPPPSSPGPASEEEEPLLGGENMNFDLVYYSPFQVQSDDNNDAPVTKRHLKELHDKIDSLIASSSTSQSSLSEAAVQKIVDGFSKAQQDSLASATTDINASTKAYQAATKKVDKLFTDASFLLKSLQESANAAKTTLEPIVHQLATSVSTELKSFASLRQTLSDDNSAFRTTIEERLSKLQEDLAAENSLMDVLARKTTALKVIKS